jgi:hypothetical protein
MRLAELVRRMSMKKSSDAVWDGFFDEMKLAVSEEEALEAAKALSEPERQRTKRYAISGAIGGVASPVIGFAGEAAKALAGPKGGRLSGVVKAFHAERALPELSKNVTKGVLGGGAVQALREHVQLQEAKKKYQDFLKEHEGE